MINEPDRDGDVTSRRGAKKKKKRKVLAEKSNWDEKLPLEKSSSE
jgi:hypothetical protein